MAVERYTAAQRLGVWAYYHVRIDIDNMAAAPTEQVTDKSSLSLTKETGMLCIRLM